MMQAGDIILTENFHLNLRNASINIDIDSVIGNTSNLYDKFSSMNGLEKMQKHTNAAMPGENSDMLSLKYK